GREGLLATISGRRPGGLRGAPRMTHCVEPITYVRESGASGENKLLFPFYHSLAEFDASRTNDQIKRKLWAYTVDDMNKRLRNEPYSGEELFMPIEKLFDRQRMR